MRATIARSAVVVATICGVTGCQSPTVHPFWNKFTTTKPSSSSPAATGSQGTQLPSTLAAGGSGYTGYTSTPPGSAAAPGSAATPYPSTTTGYTAPPTAYANPYSSSPSSTSSQYTTPSTPASTTAP